MDDEQRKKSEEPQEETEEQVQETEEQSPETFDRAYVEKLRKEAAKYRKKAETADKERQERQAAEMTESERLKAEKEAAERSAKDVTDRANQRAINAEARVTASTLGIKAERIPYALRLADLSGVEVDENGEPDAAAVKSALQAVLKNVPELKGTSTVGGGSNPASGTETSESQHFDKNPWSAAHRNLTAQATIMRENPQLADRLRKAAR